MSSDYGWTTDYILTRTLFEINWRIENIIKRLNLDREFEMSVHGMKSTGTEKKADSSLDDSQKEAMEIALLQAKKRKAEQFKNKV